MKISDWMAPSVIIALVAAVAILGYTVIYRMPDVEKQMQRLEAGQQKLEDGQSKWAEKWERQQHERFSRIETQLIKVRTNLVQLCVRSKRSQKDCQINELVATFNNVGTVQSEQLATATVEKLSGNTPKIANSDIYRALTETTRFPMVQSSSSKVDIARILVWSAAAEGARWTSSDGLLRVQFANGSAVFRPEQPVATARLVKWAADLNEITSAIELGTSIVEDDPPTKHPK